MDGGGKLSEARHDAQPISNTPALRIEWISQESSTDNADNIVHLPVYYSESRERCLFSKCYERFAMNRFFSLAFDVYARCDSGTADKWIIAGVALFIKTL